MLAGWGRFVHGHRWAVLFLSALTLIAAVLLLGEGGTPGTGQPSSGTEAQRAATVMEQDLPRDPEIFYLIFGSRTLKADDPAFEAAVKHAVKPLRDDPRVAGVVTAYDGGAVSSEAAAGPKNGPEPPEEQLVSGDGRHSLVVVELEKGPEGELVDEVYPELREEVRPGTLEVLATGGIPFDSDSGRVLEDDLRRAEFVSLPVALLVLLLVFGSAVAAGVSLGVGVLAVAAGLAADGLLARFTEVSPYATNVVAMIGLGVAIDYSLFVVSRFREELRRPGVADPEAVLARTLSTAGRAVAFSGLTVAVGLLGLAFFGDLNFLGSIGWSGSIVVLAAVFYGLTFLPALLAVLGPKVDALRVPIARRGGRTDGQAAADGFWHVLSAAVMAHPWRVLLPVIAVLLAAAAPLLGLRLGVLGPDALPRQAESRRGLELLQDQFPAASDSPVEVVLDFGVGSPTDQGHLYQTYEMAFWLSGLPGVSRVGQTGGDNAAVLSASTSYAAGSREARDLVDTIREGHPRVAGATVLVGGDGALDLDTTRAIVGRAPLAAGFVVLATYLVLFLLLGSVLLPLKAVLTNLLSIGVSYGALVWVFQEGHLSGLLGFSPILMDPALLVIVFCVVFGLSMDYEVLLLSRIKEQYEVTEDNTASVALGLEKTGRLVTGAALIMAGVFFSFGLADTVFIKALGLAMGLAVIVDATVVRALLVPATMRLLGHLNWWAPAPLARLHRRLGLSGTGEAPNCTRKGC